MKFSHNQLAAHDRLRDRLPESKRRVMDYASTHDGFTALELDSDVHPTASRRLVEMEREGLLRRGEPRANRITGDAADTWWVLAGESPRATLPDPNECTACGSRSWVARVMYRDGTQRCSRCTRVG